MARIKLANEERDAVLRTYSSTPLTCVNGSQPSTPRSPDTASTVLPYNPFSVRNGFTVSAAATATATVTTTTFTTSGAACYELNTGQLTSSIATAVISPRNNQSIPPIFLPSSVSSSLNTSLSSGTHTSISRSTITGNGESFKSYTDCNDRGHCGNKTASDNYASKSSIIRSMDYRDTKNNVDVPFFSVNSGSERRAEIEDSANFSTLRLGGTESSDDGVGLLSAFEVYSRLKAERSNTLVDMGMERLGLEPTLLSKQCRQQQGKNDQSSYICTKPAGALQRQSISSSHALAPLNRAEVNNNRHSLPNHVTNNDYSSYASGHIVKTFTNNQWSSSPRCNGNSDLFSASRLKFQEVCCFYRLSS